LSHVETTDAMVPGIRLVAPVHRALRRRGVFPAEHYLDSGYASAAQVADALKRFRVTVVMPLLADVSRQGVGRVRLVRSGRRLLSAALPRSVSLA
jgi:hypothetical protein